MKTCTDCKTEKPVSEFGKLAEAKDGLKRQCKECNAARFRKYAASEKGKEVIKAGVEKNRLKLREYWRSWYKATNRVEYYLEWRTANRDKTRGILKKYRKVNAGKVTARNRMRDASKLNATPVWADTGGIQQIYIEAQEFRDAGLDVQVDHIVPLRSKVVSGLHVPANLRVILTSHNIAKGNRHWPDMP